MRMGRSLTSQGFLDRQEFSYMAQQSGMKKVSFLESDIVASRETTSLFGFRLRDGRYRLLCDFLKGTMAAEGGKVYTFWIQRELSDHGCEGEPVTALRG